MSLGGKTWRINAAHSSPQVLLSLLYLCGPVDNGIQTQCIIKTQFHPVSSLLPGFLLETDPTHDSAQHSPRNFLFSQGRLQTLLDAKLSPHTGGLYGARSWAKRLRADA